MTFAPSYQIWEILVSPSRPPSRPRWPSLCQVWPRPRGSRMPAARWGSGMGRGSGRGSGRGLVRRLGRGLVRRPLPIHGRMRPRTRRSG